MEVFHHGNGIFQFDNFISYTNEELYDYLSSLEKFTTPEGYVKDGNRVLNSGGYEHKNEMQQSMAPIRYINTVFPEITEQQKELLRILEKALYDAVIVYCKYFPVAARSIKWRTRGYVIKYNEGQMIGPHSDAALPYREDGITPIVQSPLSNTLTCSLTLTDEFEGGELGFRPWGLRIPAKSGRLVVYPSNFIGCHEIHPITSGTRYGYLAWFSQGEIDGPPSPVNVEDVLTYRSYYLPRLSREVEGYGQREVPVGRLSSKNWKQ